MAFYTASDYKLKYRWSGLDNQGRAVRLDIYQKSTESFTLTQIGGLVSIKLSLQGSQSQIYAPIVKTSLSFTLVDAPDNIEAGYKYGNWEEFYTPDSTKYLVKLYRTQGETLTLEWQGFVTPDSWRESLQYRGSVTITARDNLGHLQDFTFDAAGDDNGLISIYSLLNAALTKIEFPMDLMHPITGDARELRDTSGNILLNSLVNISRFQDDNWYSVLESVLESVGYCLRYVSDAKFVIQPVRDLPIFASTSREDVLDDSLEIEFYGGNRSNDPAYRQIKEKLNFGSEDEVSFDVFRNLGFSSSTEIFVYDCKYFRPSLMSWLPFNNRYWTNTDTDGEDKGGWLPGNGFLFASIFGVSPELKAQDGENALHLGVGLICGLMENYGDVNIRPTYRIPEVGSTDVTLAFEFAKPVTITGRSITTPSLNKVAPLNHFMMKAAVYITYTDPATDTLYYWNGTNWQQAPFLIELDMAEELAESYGFEVSLADISDTAALGGFIDIEFANFYTAGEDAPSMGAYVRLTAIKAKINARAVLRSDTVTTINDPNYNVMIERKPVVGALSVEMPVFRPGNYPGALWTYGTYGPVPYGYANYWRGFDASTAIPLPAQIHKQLLCFNHISLSTLDGTFGAVDKSELVTFGREVNYKGKHYLIQNGTLDVLLNRMSNGILHEYIWYDDLWDETHNPTYTGSPSYDVRSGVGGMNGITPSGGGGGKNYFEEDGNGGIKLKDEYLGLSANGFITGGGVGSGGGGGGVSIDRVWQSLTNNPADPDYENTKIALAHIPDITISMISNLASWTGSANITTVGTITSGAWNGTAIPVSKGGTGRTNFTDAPYAVLVMSSSNSIGYVTNNNTSTRKYLSQVSSGVPEWVEVNSSVPAATDSTIGGFKTGYTTGNKNYAVQLDSNDKAFVNVPWSDNNTIYKLTVNGTEKGTSGGTDLGSIYAPVDSGSDGNLLVSKGSGYAPQWASALPSLRLQPTGANYGSHLYFGDDAYAYIHEDTDDHLLFYADKGVKINVGASYGLDITATTTIGTSTSNKNLTVYGSLYVGASYYWNIDSYSRMHTNADVKVDGAMIIGGTSSNKDLTVFGKLRLGTTASPAPHYLDYDATHGAIHTDTNFYADGFLDCGGVASSSDERLKTNLQPVQLTIAQIAGAPAVTFDWADRTRGRGAGSIAQYWQKLLPENVRPFGEGYLSMEYGNIALISVIIAARKIQELETEIKDLKRRLAA